MKQADGELAGREPRDRSKRVAPQAVQESDQLKARRVNHEDSGYGGDGQGIQDPGFTGF